MNILWTLEMIDLLDTMKPYNKRDDRTERKAKVGFSRLYPLSSSLEFSSSRNLDVKINDDVTLTPDRTWSESVVEQSAQKTPASRRSFVAAVFNITYTDLEDINILYIYICMYKRRCHALLFFLSSSFSRRFF